jgi:hypothetical protein
MAAITDGTAPIPDAAPPAISAPSVLPTQAAPAMIKLSQAAANTSASSSTIGNGAIKEPPPMPARIDPLA